MSKNQTLSWKFSVGYVSWRRSDNLCSLLLESSATMGKAGRSSFQLTQVTPSDPGPAWGLGFVISAWSPPLVVCPPFPKSNPQLSEDMSQKRYLNQMQNQSFLHWNLLSSLLPWLAEPLLASSQIRNKGTTFLS